MIFLLQILGPRLGSSMQMRHVPGIAQATHKLFDMLPGTNTIAPEGPLWLPEGQMCHAPSLKKMAHTRNASQESHARSHRQQGKGGLPGPPSRVQFPILTGSLQPHNCEASPSCLTVH